MHVHVCESVRSLEAIQLFLRKAPAGCYIREPTNTACQQRHSKLKEVLLQSLVQNEIVKYRFTHGSQKTAKVLDSVIEIVHGCFMEKGDSILSTFGGKH